MRRLPTPVLLALLAACGGGGPDPEAVRAEVDRARAAATKARSSGDHDGELKYLRAALEAASSHASLRPLASELRVQVRLAEEAQAGRAALDVRWEACQGRYEAASAADGAAWAALEKSEGRGVRRSELAGIQSRISGLLLELSRLETESREARRPWARELVAARDRLGALDRRAAAAAREQEFRPTKLRIDRDCGAEREADWRPGPATRAWVEFLATAPEGERRAAEDEIRTWRARGERLVSRALGREGSDLEEAARRVEGIPELEERIRRPKR